MLVNLNFGDDKPMASPIVGLPGGPLETLLDYLIQTKSSHFAEENECRLSVLDPISSENGVLPVEHFNRDGLVVPYTKTPSVFDVLACIDWIVVGPGPRIDARFNSIVQLVKNKGLHIKVRPSHMPLSRS